MPRVTFARESIALAVSLVAACMPFIEWEEVGTEDRIGLCRDEVDNDFDGLVDCADPDCWTAPPDPNVSRGTCNEHLGGLCNDGLDNDANGLTDRFDLSCSLGIWSDRIERCGSVQGSSIRLSANDHDWIGETPTSEGLVLAPAAESQLRAPVTGGSEGSRLEIDVELEDGAEMMLVLSPGEPDGRATISAVARRSGREVIVSARLAEISATQSDSLTVEGPPAGITVSLRLTRFTLEVEAMGSMLELTTRDGFEDAPAWELSISNPGTGVTRIGRLSIDRPTHNPCDEVEVPSRQPWSTGTIHTFTASNETFCGIVERPDSGLVVVSGPRVPPIQLGLPHPIPSLEEVGPFSVDGREVSLPVATWDPLNRRFVGAVRDPDVSNRILLYFAEACEGPWTVLGAAQAERSRQAHPWRFGETEGVVLGYHVMPRSGRHMMWVTNPSAEGDARIERWCSETGQERSFVRVRTRDVSRGLSPINLKPIYSAVGVSEGIDQLELTALRNIVTARDFDNVYPVLLPSSIPGSFDAHAIVAATAWFPPPEAGKTWSGIFAYSARPCPSCPSRIGFARIMPLVNPGILPASSATELPELPCSAD